MYIYTYQFIKHMLQKLQLKNYSPDLIKLGRLFFHIYSFVPLEMSCQIPLLSKSSCAKWTFEWTFTSMNSHVLYQTRLFSKRSMTNITYIRLMVNMILQVTIKSRSIFEEFITMWTWWFSFFTRLIWITDIWNWEIS